MIQCVRYHTIARGLIIFELRNLKHVIYGLLGAAGLAVPYYDKKCPMSASSAVALYLY